MAQGKASFMFYCDWKETFDALPNEKAGELLKHILAYVNDENPKTDDLLINAVFANIKATLKRDLKKWERKSEQNKLNALKRWDANAYERIKEDANYADKDKVIDKDKERVSQYSDTDFLKDWNETRKDVLKKPSFLNNLSFEDKENLRHIVKSLENPKEEITKALRGLFKQKTFPRGQDYTLNAKHFLNFFSQYLQAYYDKNANIYGNELKSH